MSIFDRVSRLLSETSGCAGSFGLTQRDVSFLHDLSARAPAILSEKQEKWLSDLEARVFGKPEEEAKPEPIPREHGMPRGLWETRFLAATKRHGLVYVGGLADWPEKLPDWREWSPEDAAEDSMSREPEPKAFPEDVDGTGR